MRSRGSCWAELIREYLAESITLLPSTSKITQEGNYQTIIIITTITTITKCQENNQDNRNQNNVTVTIASETITGTF